MDMFSNFVCFFFNPFHYNVVLILFFWLYVSVLLAYGRDFY
jgi:hypothetical protein